MANVIQTVLKNGIVNVDEIIRNPKEYDGQKVVTFKDIDAVHGRVEGTARKRFNENRERFIETVDYFVRKTDEAKREFGIIAPNGLILLTETGYLMLVKSFTDDLAWTVQRELVNHYFKVQPNQEIDKYHSVIKDGELNQLKIAAKDFAVYYFDKLTLKGQGRALQCLYELVHNSDYTAPREVLLK